MTSQFQSYLNPLPFSLPYYSLPISTPATPAITVCTFYFHYQQVCFMIRCLYTWKLLMKVINKKSRSRCERKEKKNKAILATLLTTQLNKTPSLCSVPIQSCLDCFSLVSFVCFKPAPRGHETGDRSVRNTNKHQNTLLVHLVHRLIHTEFSSIFFDIEFAFRPRVASHRRLIKRSPNQHFERINTLQGQNFFQRPG